LDRTATFNAILGAAVIQAGCYRVAGTLHGKALNLLHHRGDSKGSTSFLRLNKVAALCCQKAGAHAAAAQL